MPFLLECSSYFMTNGCHHSLWENEYDSLGPYCINPLEFITDWNVSPNFSL